jgi:hypothetical protein
MYRHRHIGTYIGCERRNACGQHTMSVVCTKWTIHPYTHTHTLTLAQSLTLSYTSVKKYTCPLSLYLSVSAYVLDELVVGEHKEFVEGVAYAIVGSLKAPVPNRQINRKMDTQ